MGGLERQILEISKMLSNKDYKVYIITLDQSDFKPFFDLQDTNLSAININIGNPDIPGTLTVKLKRQIRIVSALRKIKPDVGIAFMYGGFLMSRLGMFLINRPLILAERNSPAMYDLTKIARFRKLLFLTMFFTTKITVQFDSYIAKYPWYLRRKIVAIPNTIVDCGIFEKKENNKVRYVFAGRFSFQKQIIRLVDAFRIFHDNFPESTLAIYGEGEQKNLIEEKILEYKMCDYATLFGPSSLEEIFTNTDVICVPSKWEGFPNILAETLKAGIPAIGFSNCDGVGNLIQDERNGWTEEDDNSTAVIVRLLERSYRGVKMKTIGSSKIRESMEIYSTEEIATKWHSLLKFTNRS